MSPPCRARSSPLRRGLVLASLIGLPACGRAEDRTAVARVRLDWPAPMNDSTDRCADVADLRICFGARGLSGVSITRAVTPAVEPSPMGFRCTGDGARRTCRDRLLDAGPFERDGARWVQRHPRFPDPGEWECADLNGVVLCRGGERAAGAAPGKSDPGFHCGSRVVNGIPTPERLCVDFAPDTPRGTPRGLRCRFDAEAGVARVCEAAPAAAAVTDRCDGTRGCLPGLVCEQERCVPRSRDPSCWLDADCGEKVCRFGVCTARSP